MYNPREEPLKSAALRFLRRRFGRSIAFLSRMIWRISGSNHNSLYKNKLYVLLWRCNRLISNIPSVETNEFRVSFGSRGKFLLDLSRLTDSFCFVFGPGEFEIYEVTKKVLAVDSIVIDVGGNIGSFAIPVSGLCHEGTVHCFEPFAPIREILEGNIDLSGRNNICVHPFAVGSVNGHCRMKVVSKHNPGSNYVELCQESDEGALPVQRLDEFINESEKVSLIKIDVEGFEMEVIRGAKNLIERNSPVIIFEVNCSSLERVNSTRSTIYEFLEEHGYAICVLRNGSLIDAREIDSVLGVFNVVALPRSFAKF